MTDLPRFALSVRQPWAWAIIHGGKDVENRTRAAIDKGNMRAAVGQRIAIHASKGMTQIEYRSALTTFAAASAVCPMPDELLRGGIIGTVEVVGIVAKPRDHFESPWFFGPYGLLLRRPEACPFIGCSGALGLFKPKPNDEEPEPAARWMLPPKAKPAPFETQKELL